jgi:hypothetical protein
MNALKYAVAAVSAAIAAAGLAAPVAQADQGSSGSYLDPMQCVSIAARVDPPVVSLCPAHTGMK